MKDDKTSGDSAVDISVRVGEEMKRQAAYAIEESIALLWEDMKRAYSEHNVESGEFKFTPTLSLPITPQAGDFAVGAKMSWSVRKKVDVAEVVVSDQPELPGVERKGGAK